MRKPSQNLSKEFAIIIFTIISTLAITVLTTLSGAGFDPNRLTAVEVYTNIILNSVIVLVVTVVALPYGKLNTMCKRNTDGSGGKYITAFNAFNVIYNLVKPKLNQFEQWHTKKYEQEVLEKQIRYLSQKGIRQVKDILKLDRVQIENLTTAQMYKVQGEELFFSSLTKKQIKACLKVYDGEITVHKLPDHYFLYIDGKSTSSFYEQAYHENLLNNYYVISRVLFKVLFGLVIACVLTSLVTDSIVLNSQTLLKIFTNLLSRILTIGQSLYGGYSIGQNLIYKKCYYIDGRTQILTEFNDDTTFVYVDPQEIAKQEYISERSAVNETEDTRQDSVLD